LYKCRCRVKTQVIWSHVEDRHSREQITTMSQEGGCLPSMAVAWHGPPPHRRGRSARCGRSLRRDAMAHRKNSTQASRNHATPWPREGSTDSGQRCSPPRDASHGAPARRALGGSDLVAGWRWRVAFPSVPTGEGERGAGPSEMATISAWSLPAVFSLPRVVGRSHASRHSSQHHHEASGPRAPHTRGLFPWPARPAK
jgi:hypothetical protein